MQQCMQCRPADFPSPAFWQNAFHHMAASNANLSFSESMAMPGTACIKSGCLSMQAPSITAASKQSSMKKLSVRPGSFHRTFGSLSKQLSLQQGSVFSTASDSPSTIQEAQSVAEFVVSGDTEVTSAQPLATPRSPSTARERPKWTPPLSQTRRLEGQTSGLEAPEATAASAVPALSPLLEGHADCVQPVVPAHCRSQQDVRGADVAPRGESLRMMCCLLSL